MVNNEIGLQFSGVSHSYGAVQVLNDVNLSVPAGSITCLLGPSGCGKTTFLRLSAGLESLQRGEIFFDGEKVADANGSIAPEIRGVGLMFQDYMLFPHLSVLENVRFGLGGLSVGEQVKKAKLALEQVGMAEFRSYFPHMLSGGEQQRVALARAIVPRPKILLLDEPFSNLDSALRIEVRAEVNRLISELGVTTIFVTHDQDEAFLLGDRVAVMNDGKILQVDSPNIIYEKPSNNWIASFVGAVNLVTCKASGHKAETPIGFLKLDQHYEGNIELVIRPENLMLTSGDDAVIETTEYYGHDSLVTVKLNDGTKLKVRTAPATPHSKGDRVGLEHKDVEVSAFGKKS